MVWNENFIKNILASFENSSRAGIQIYVRSEPDLNTVMQYNADNNEILYSQEICNDELLPDFVVTSALAFIYSAIKLELQNYNNISQVRNYASNLCDDIGSKYIGEDECEEYIRLVRRRHFPDPMKNGCYFSIGDIVRAKPGGGPHRYKVVDITKSEETDEAIVTIRAIDNKNNKSFTYKEAELYNYYTICWED